MALVPVVEVPTRKASEVDELLRFRLRKSIPFEVREARLAYATAGDSAADTIVVATAFGPVVAQYEEVCRSLGLEPGLVEMAGLALARAAFPAPASGDGLLVNWDDGLRDARPRAERVADPGADAVRRRGRLAGATSSARCRAPSSTIASGWADPGLTTAFVRSAVVPAGRRRGRAGLRGRVRARGAGRVDALRRGARPRCRRRWPRAAASLGAPE